MLDHSILGVMAVATASIYLCQSRRFSHLCNVMFCIQRADIAISRVISLNERAYDVFGGSPLKPTWLSPTGLFL